MKWRELWRDFVPLLLTMAVGAVTSMAVSQAHRDRGADIAVRRVLTIAATFCRATICYIPLLARGL